MACSMLALILSLAIVAPPLHAAPASPSGNGYPYLITPITNIRGLEGANVRMSLQTRDGYLWLATSVGLIRYDGLDAVTYRPANTPAFTTPDVRTLFEDRDGALWIGTAQGVVRFYKDAFTRISLDDASTRAFAQDKSGAIWIGTFGQGLYSWRDGTLQKHPQRFTPESEFILSLCIDSSDRLWIGSNAPGIVCRERPDDPATTFQRLYASSAATAAIPGFINCITEHPRGTLWFGSQLQGLYRLAPDDRITNFGTAQGLTTKQVTQITPSADGGLWIASGGLQKIPATALDTAAPGDSTRDASAQNVSKNRILTPVAEVTDERILAFTEDHEGNLWFCARIAGLLRARRSHHALINTDDGLPGDSIKTISRDRDGNLWIAIRRAGIVKLAPDNTITPIPAPPDQLPLNDPELALAATDGSLWTLWQRQVYLWKDNHYTQLPNIRDAFGIFEDSQGIIWIGRSNRIDRYKDGKLLEDSANAAINTQIRRAIVFHETPDGTLYIGSWTNGLYKYAQGRLTHYSTDNGLPGNNVRAVFVDSTGCLWAGIRDCGLVTLGDDGRWHGSDTLSQAVADQVSVITEDDRGNLWLGTTAGVMWAPREQLLRSAHTGDAVQGMHALSVIDSFTPSPIWVGASPTLARANDGRYLFATRQGLLAIDPRQNFPATAPPPIHIKTAIADGHPLDLHARPVRVSAGTRSLTFEYTGLSYVRPDRMAFKYRLDNKADWQDAGTSRRVTFADLRPGDYRFEVTARNADGAWNPAPGAIAITVLPRFYETLWFRIAALAALALAVAAFIQRRTRRLRRRAAELARQNAELEARVQERTLELTLSNTAKSEFLENISHEIRNPLNGITGLIEQLDDAPATPLNPEQREHARALKASARQLNRVFEEILDYSKLEYGYITTHETRFSLVALLAEIRDTFAPQAAASRATLEFKNQSPGAADQFIGDETKIRTIIDNFVTNAIKYAPGAPITVTLTITDRQTDQTDSSDRFDHSAFRSPQSTFSDILIEVADRGPGVPPDEQELIFKKFARGAAARQSGIAGTGIGLATCAATAKHLGGAIGIDSHPGHGSTFFLKIPLCRALAENTGAPQTQTAVNPAHAQTGDNTTALIVEDQHYNQIVLAGLVRKHGIQSACAATAAEALAKIEARPSSRPFDLIFLDIELPDMKGTDLARLIRARPGGAQAIIIGTSAHDSDEIRTRCLASGMDDFHLKPLRENSLIAAIALHSATRDHTPSPVSAVAVIPHSEIRNPHSPDDPGPLDLSALELYAEHTPGGLPAAKKIFIETLRNELASLAAAHDARDNTTTAKAAHRVRSHSTLVGAPHLCAAAGELEKRCRTGGSDSIPTQPLLVEIESRATTLIAQLK